MSASYIFASVALIVAPGYIGVSWAVAGAGLCEFATGVLLRCWSLRPVRHPLRITDAKPEKRSKVDLRPVGCRKAPPPRCVVAA
jgi:hypothetical protein